MGRTENDALLPISNLYPLGRGYGRCMAGMGTQEGHIIQVLSSNAPPWTKQPDRGEQVDRRLKPAGSFQDGPHHLHDSTVRLGVDSHNRNLLSHCLPEV